MEYQSSLQTTSVFLKQQEITREMVVSCISMYEVTGLGAERRYLSFEVHKLLAWLRKRWFLFHPSQNTSPSRCKWILPYPKELLKEAEEKKGTVEDVLERGTLLLQKLWDIILHVDLANLLFFWNTYYCNIQFLVKNYSKIFQNHQDLFSHGFDELYKERKHRQTKDYQHGNLEARSFEWKGRFIRYLISPKINSQFRRVIPEKKIKEEEYVPLLPSSLEKKGLNLHSNSFSADKTGQRELRVCPSTKGLQTSKDSLEKRETLKVHKTSETISDNKTLVKSTSFSYDTNHLPICVKSHCLTVVEYTVSDMETLKNQTRSQQNLSLVGEVILPNFEIAGSKEKKNGSFPNLASPNVDLPTEAKRRRIMGEEMSVASTVSSQVSSRSHSPTFSESLDDSFLSTPGNSPSATLKEKFRRKYGKYELVSAIDQYLLDKEIIEACQSPEEEEEEIDANTKVSLTEFRQQYKELSEWLNQMQKVTQKTIGTLSASERYLAQSQHEDLLLQSAPRFKPFNDYAKRLLQRFPGLKQEIDERVHFLKSQWSIVEQAVSSKAMWQNTDTMFKDLESDIHHFRKWLNETETKLFSLGLKPQSTDEDVQKCLADHQILQKDIESHSRYISAVLRLSDRLHDEFEDSPNHDYYLLAEEANHLQRHWHEIWLQSLECQCKLENALKNKKASISPQSFLTGWIPQNYHKEYDNLGSSLGSDDSLTLLNRGADLVDSPPLDYSCSLSTSGDTSGKDSAVVSEVEIKMSSECSDSDLDMLRKTRLKSENRDVGYSSGASVSPLPNGHTSTESDCDDIKRLIEKVDSLVGEKPKSPKRQRKVESPSKQRPPYSSCDASSEESDASVEEFSTASDDVDALFDSVLGLDYNSDASLQQNLPKLCNTVKLRQARRKKKDRPWSAIQSMDLDNVDLVELSKSESAIDRLKDASDASETPKRQLHSGSATLPRAGAKRKLYEPTVKELASFDSDCESSTCEEYETARSDMSISEEDENVVSTASFSEPTWDNYHQVYISLGEEEEQPLTWSPLEEDLEFDEEFSIQQNSSIIKEAIEKRKLKTKPKLVSQSSRHGYDSDSDFEELCYLIDESAAHLKIADNHLKKKCKDFKGSGIDINTNRYAEIIATCQTNIKCLQIVLRHLNTTDDTTEEETEKIKDLLYQWEKLYAFAIERQTQSQQLSQMNRCLEEVELELRLCEVATDMDTFSNIRDVEFCLISVQTKLESLPCLYGKLDDLKLKSSAFQLEHPAINLQHFVQEQEQAKDSLIEKQEKLNKRLPELRQMFSVWSEYVQLKAELNDLLTQKLNTSCTAAAMRSGKTDLVSEKQTLNESLLKCEEKCRALQSLRGQLMSVVNDRMKAELTNDVADFQDRLTEIDRQYRTLLWSVEQDEACTMEQTNAGSDSVAQTQVSPVSTSSSSSSPPSSWYSSRYVKAAGAFMIFGIAYLYDPDTIKRLGDLSFTLTPELKYVNGPPPM